MLVRTVLILLAALIAMFPVLGSVPEQPVDPFPSSSSESPSSSEDPIIDDEDLVMIPAVRGENFNDVLDAFMELGLKPELEYVYDFELDFGKAISCDPVSGTFVDVGTEVKIYVSNGMTEEDDVVYSQESYMNWTFISDDKDWWEFNNPYITGGMLVIECTNVTFAADMTWIDESHDGTGDGVVSTDSSFNSPASAFCVFENESYKAGEEQSFDIIVPMYELSEERPEKLYFKMDIEVDGEPSELEFNLSVTW